MRTIFLRVVAVVMLSGIVYAGAASAATDVVARPIETAADSAPSGKVVCEASAGTRRELHALSSRETYTLDGRQEYLKALDALLAKNPDDLFLHLDYIHTENRESKAEVAAVIERYKQLMERHSRDSEYEFLYATVLIDNNTPEAIERLKRLPADASVAPQAELRLSKINEFGKFANRDEARLQLSAYLKACPASADALARDLAERLATAEIAGSYAAALRSRLEKDHDPTLLSAWLTAWNMEFAATPAQQEQVRVRLTQDLQRLRARPAKDLDYLTTMQEGYRMAGDKKAQREIEDRMLAEYPDNSETEIVEWRRFEEEHPYPKEEDSEATKQAFYHLQLVRADAELKRNPKKSEALRDRFEALEDMEGVSTDDVVNAGEALRAAMKGELNWATTPPMQFQIARVYLDRNVGVEEVPDLIAEGRVSYARWNGRIISDRESDELLKSIANNETWVLLTEADLLVDAARALQKPEIAKAVMEKVAAEKIEGKYFQVRVWEIKGKWAELNGKKLDALLMYRASLDSRVVGFKVRGKKKDEAKEGYERLWKELGGTDSGADAWLVAAASSKAAADGNWERVGKDLPDAKLVDLNGKTWTLSELKGKTVLINVWASWCGPCRGEHPYLQALYEKVKDRKDIAVMSMSIDDSIGDVAPYMNDKKYSFPVLLASQYVNGVAPAVGVPQNWIVGADGKWEWKQEGFGDGEGWEKAVMEKLEGKEGVGKK
jgi:thiol-disulfide isomerase/thioredoxin